ncbi:MAG TPA: FG-GAP-like repeat-containing protein [Lysobacter sp.]|nr:FG-GAP-like repeat-containing protein [Lysobacter sp.]
MRTVLVFGLISGLLAGCSADSSQTSGLLSGEATRPKVSDSMPIPTWLNSSAIAGLPDRGSLVAYSKQPPVRKGTRTWHAVQLSEEHAQRAVIGGTMVVDAPDGTPIRLRYERHVEHPDGNWTWVGRPIGARSGIEAIVTFGEKAVFGEIPYGDEEPLQLTMAAGRTWLVETDKTALAAAQEPKSLAEDFLVPPARMPLGKPATSKSAQMTSADAITPPPSEAATAANTVDVVIGYTTGFATRLGGQSQAVTRLNFMVDIANQAYANSQVNGQLRLVQTVMVSYPDATANRNTLFELSGVDCVPGPGGQLPDGGVSCTFVGQPAALQPLIAARNQYGADLVSLVRRFESPENGSCGLGWLLGGGQTVITSSNANFGMSVVSDSSGNLYPDNGSNCRNETLAHELGHNMGLQHDRARAQGTDDSNGDGNPLDPEEYGRYPYSFGYSVVGEFHTIMAIPAPGQTSYRVFSNPRINSCGGFACGVADQADNARTLEQTMPVIASFRASLIPLVGAWFRGDFDGDGKSDLLWRNRSTGQNVIWKSANSATPQAVTTVANQTWMVIGASDFDGDGKSDILWRNSVTGANAIWKSGNSATPQPMATVASQAWVIVGAGDFGGDGKSDVLWRNGITGANVIWRSGNSATSQAITTVANQAWAVVGVGDFDGDNRADILWRNRSTGENRIWRSGNSATAQTPATVGNLTWRVVGIGDFDGDNKSDILWRNSLTGANAIWKSGNSATPLGVNPVGDLTWVIVGAGDFNGDNKSDILWRNISTGNNAIWRSGSSAASQAVTPVASQAWAIAG